MFFRHLKKERKKLYNLPFGEEYKVDMAAKSNISQYVVPKRPTIDGCDLTPESFQRRANTTLGLLHRLCYNDINTLINIASTEHMYGASTEDLNMLSLVRYAAIIQLALKHRYLAASICLRAPFSHDVEDLYIWSMGKWFGSHLLQHFRDAGPFFKAYLTLPVNVFQLEHITDVIQTKAYKSTAECITTMPDNIQLSHTLRALHLMSRVGTREESAEFNRHLLDTSRRRGQAINVYYLSVLFLERPLLDVYTIFQIATLAHGTGVVSAAREAMIMLIMTCGGHKAFSQQDVNDWPNTTSISTYFKIMYMMTVGFDEFIRNLW